MIENKRNPMVWAVVPAIQAAYVLVFPVAFGVLGAAIGIVPTSTILLAAWLLGMRAAVLAAVTSVIASTLLYGGVGIELGVALRSSFAAAAFFLIVGIVVARIRSDKQRIERLTLFDNLTGLPNREVFEKKLQLRLAAGLRAQVALVHVSGFRDLNESLGHEVGDEVILEIGRRLRSAFDAALVARFGTDDFAVLAHAGETDQSIAERALDGFRAPFIVAGSLISVEGRVGIARAPEHGDRSAAVMSAAASAMRSARSLAAGWAIASPTRSQDYAARLRMVADLRQALDGNQLRLHYQPLLDVTSGTVVGFEALMRWQRDGEMVPPAEFIPLAEQTGLIVPLTDWVVNEALRQSAEWARVGHPMRISINAGAKAIGSSSHLETVIAQAAAQHGVPASQLTVEVTETDVMVDQAQSSRTLSGLKKLGVRVAVDDFGTGYSSLGYLNALPLDEVKIDRSFISRLLQEPQTALIVRAAIELTHALGLDAVAEGVEDQATLDRLTALGCDRAQGYFFARPMPADAVLPWLQRYAPIRATLPVPAVAVVATTPHSPAISTVLVVDDEPLLGIATHRILSRQGFNVLNASSGSEAIRICSQEPGAIDLVVADIFLTDWRGHELAGRLRKMQPDVRFLFVSGDPMASDLVMGAPFLAKPFSNQQLVDRVGSVLAA